MQFLGKGHSDGHPLMPQHGAEPSLSASAGQHSSSARVHHTGDTNRREGALGTDSPVVVVGHD